MIPPNRPSSSRIQNGVASTDIARMKVAANAHPNVQGNVMAATNS